VSREAEIVVRAEEDHFATIHERGGALWGSDPARQAEEAGVLDLFEAASDVLDEAHGGGTTT
jgi:hypothetical protein